jgi:hypothetical protein
MKSEEIKKNLARVFAEESKAQVRVSAVYICPVRGLADLLPPEPKRLGRAAGVARNLGIEQLFIPVLEESLLVSIREKISYFDGLVQALDQLEANRLGACLILPARKILGLKWVIPDVAKALADPDADPVFVAGKVRNLRPHEWWADPFIVQKSIRAFREALRAVEGHPALKGWSILDRALEWGKPDVETAYFVLKALMAEIQEGGGRESVEMGFGWCELLKPQTVHRLSADVEKMRIGGLETAPPGFEPPGSLAEEVLLAAFLGSLASWLFKKPTGVELGWALPKEKADGEALIEHSLRLAGQGLGSVTWITLIDPEPLLHKAPPWTLRSGLERCGLLDSHLTPKAWVEEWIREVQRQEPRTNPDGFIDVSREEYLEEPEMHFRRLWSHFREIN